MTPDLVDLIRSHMDDLGLDRAALVRRLGTGNGAKARRRLDAVLNGDLRRYPVLLDRLRAALSIEDATFEEAMAESRRRAAEKERRAGEESDKAWRAAFAPHALIDTEFTRPTPLTFAAMVGAHQVLTIPLDTTRPPVTYARQALDALASHRWHSDGKVAFFGRVLGIVVNYHPDHAVRFDLDGNPVETLAAARRVGSGNVVLRSGRTMPEGVFAERLRPSD